MRQLTLRMFIGKKPWEIAEARIREFMRRYRMRWLYVMFSGGRDSGAVLAAAKAVTDDIVAVYIHIVGQTHHDNVRAALETARRLGLPVVRLVAKRGVLRQQVAKLIEERGLPLMLHVIAPDYQRGLDYWSALRVYGFPAPRERWGAGKRWCCSHFKSDWMAELPPNAVVDGRQARTLAVGIRLQESSYRRKLWREASAQQLPIRTFKARDGVTDYALAPILDFTTEEVDEVLRHYGVADAILPQYRRWRRAPNCVLCPLQGKAECRLALQNMPTSFLRRVKSVLEELLPRYREGTYSRQKIEEWLAMIEEELARRSGR